MVSSRGLLLGKFFSLFRGSCFERVARLGGLRGVERKWMSNGGGLQRGKGGDGPGLVPWIRSVIWDSVVYKRFLERLAKDWSGMICCYSK